MIYSNDKIYSTKLLTFKIMKVKTLLVYANRYEGTTEFLTYYLYVYCTHRFNSPYWMHISAKDTEKDIIYSMSIYIDYLVKQLQYILFSKKNYLKRAISNEQI